MWLSLAAAVNERMAELDLDQADLADEAGLSAQVIRDLQRGLPRQYRSTTMLRVARALGWPADAFPRILNGFPLDGDTPPPVARPRPASSPGAGQERRADVGALESQVSDLERSLADLRRELDEMRGAG